MQPGLQDNARLLFLQAFYVFYFFLASFQADQESLVNSQAMRSCRGQVLTPPLPRCVIWASSLTPLSLNCLIYRMGMMIL